MSDLAIPESTALIIPGEVSAVGLVLPEGLSFEHWEAVVKQISFVTRACLWWIGDALNYGEKKWGEKYAQALDYEWATISNAKYVASRIHLSRRRENLSFNHHAEVAALDKEVADSLLDEAAQENWNRDELRRAVRRARRSVVTQAMPSDRYRVLYADPPWRYSDKLVEGYGPAEHHYQTLSIDDLSALPISEITADDAVLFLWVTSPILPECFRVIEAWGFEYKSSFVWDKVKHNMGHYNSVRHELLLICTKGSCTPDNPQLVDSVVQIERLAHSEKPEYFRQLIDSLYPHGKRIELFSRCRAEGWLAWGDQTVAA